MLAEGPTGGDLVGDGGDHNTYPSGDHMEEEFRRLGIGIWLQPECGTGPLRKRRMERGTSVLTRMPQLSTFHRRSTVAGSLALAITLHGVELAEAFDIDLVRPETQTVQAIWAHEAG